MDAGFVYDLPIAGRQFHIERSKEVKKTSKHLIEPMSKTSSLSKVAYV
jgi:hypothetical protein